MRSPTEIRVGDRGYHAALRRLGTCSFALEKIIRRNVCTAVVVTISMLEDDLISHHLINWNSQLCLSKLQGVSVMGELLRLTNYDGMKLRKILLIIITAIILDT